MSGSKSPLPALDGSALARPDQWPLLPARAAAGLGPTLVVAPHPDDESLGCGGLIALLRQASLAVRVLFVSDGSGSHPNSVRYPRPALAALRQSEAWEALARLGVDASAVTFLGLPDTAVPNQGQPGFEEAVEACAELGRQFQPTTIVAPWRRDPHCDHRASWQIVAAARQRLSQPTRLLEYPIWVWTLAEGDDAPQPGEMRAWRLDVGPVQTHKQAAVAAHRSQTTDLIDDDPTGFRLTPQLLADFARPWELYLEAMSE